MFLNVTANIGDRVVIYHLHKRPASIYLKIIPRKRVGYELLDSARGVEHRFGYHKFISNESEWINCFVKYQTLDKSISNFISHGLEFLAIVRENFP